MDDWKPGDEAQCIVEGQWIANGHPGPTFLSVHTVTSVDLPHPQWRDWELALGFASFPSARYCSSLFRKVYPLDEEEERQREAELEDS